ncbi:BI1-like protein isoform X1 [Olea europaea var. sylvestris]|uniref:BI1-like protein isoform X1 n=1 Tax=Olea europaea var. sylvestris TaxID=158386 RepID=UPI000C1D412B|nr:BI1-like protein isoform X1 [Olea europaea var. sylvestris]
MICSVEFWLYALPLRHPLLPKNCARSLNLDISRSFALTGYTFWDSCLLALLCSSHLDSIAIYNVISAIIFAGYIVYDTDNLIKRFTYDEYIWASATLYLDVLNLFHTILRMIRQGDN